MPRTTTTVPKVYSVVPEDPRVLVGLVPFPIAGRNPALPPLYRYEGIHPQLLTAVTPATVVYVYLVDSSPEGRQVSRSLSESMSVPGGMINQPGGNPGSSGLLSVTAYPY